MANDVAVYDEEMLKLLGGLANKDDAGGSLQGPPTLKINYDPDSIHPRGEWVVGQKKAQDGSIAEEGELVKGLVILLARNRWSFYNKKDTTKNCNSPFYLRGDLVRGNNYQYVCGKTCPMRADGIDPRCKCQIVLFGLAVTAEGKMIDCISYLGGDSYMPVQTYLNTIEKAKVKGGYVQIPLFARLTLLGAERKQNEGTKYFVANLSDGGMFRDRDKLIHFSQKRDEVLEYLNRANAITAEPVNDHQQAGAAAGSAPAPMTPATPAADPVVNATVVTPPATQVAPVTDPAVPDFAKMLTGDGGSAGAADAAPWETQTADAPATDPATTTVAPAAAAQRASGDGAFDLIGAIENLIQK